MEAEMLEAGHVFTPLAARPPGDELAARIAIQHQIAAIADGILLGDDTRAHLNDHERVVHLTEAVGDACADVLRNRALDLDACLVRIGAEVTLWLECRAREAVVR
jgi:hypothetical protein